MARTRRAGLVRAQRSSICGTEPRGSVGSHGIVVTRARVPARTARSARFPRTRGVPVYSEPAYVPAVAGKSSLTILKLATSLVASTWRYTEASRKYFSIPISSMAP